MGSGLAVISATFPLRIRITRSAMAVNAELWVMIITVFPVWRQVSCSSFKTALPVASTPFFRTGADLPIAYAKDSREIAYLTGASYYLCRKYIDNDHLYD